MGTPNLLAGEGWVLRLLSSSAIIHIAGHVPARRKAVMRQREHPDASLASGDFGCSTLW